MLDFDTTMPNNIEKKHKRLVEKQRLRMRERIYSRIESETAAGDRPVAPLLTPQQQLLFLYKNLISKYSANHNNVKNPLFN